MNPSKDFYFSHARTALKYGLSALGYKPGDELLLPSFICDVVIHPLDSLGILPRYYPVTPSLEPDWQSLPPLVGPKTRAFMIVHYFGFPQDLTRSRSFCQDNGLLLIEDNAHGYGGTFEGQRLGSFGEIGISSPRKSFGWRNGGLLHWNREETPFFHELPPQPGARMWNLKKILRRKIRSLAQIKRRLKGMPNYSSQDIGRESPIPDWSMDPEYALTLERELESLEVMIEKRRKLWEVWGEWAKQNNLASVFSSLPPGTNPLVFPIRTGSPEESQQWFRWGWEHGINVHSWPTLPREIAANDQHIVNLWRTIVCFPLDIRMKPSGLKTVLTASELDF